MEFFFGAPWHIKKNEDVSIIYECAYDDDDPGSTCGGVMVECEHRVHISILPTKCVQCPLQESCLHRLFTKM